MFHRSYFSELVGLPDKDFLNEPANINTSQIDVRYVFIHLLMLTTRNPYE